MRLASVGHGGLGSDNVIGERVVRSLLFLVSRTLSSTQLSQCGGATSAVLWWSLLQGLYLPLSRDRAKEMSP